MSQKTDAYYIPEGSYWPIIGTVGVTAMLMGFAHSLHGGTTLIAWAGLAITIFMLFGWFRDVISENMSGRYNRAVDLSFRWGMGWFIFSEVMFFAAFFGALFYARVLSVPWLGGASNNAWTAQLLWPDFQAIWPLLSPPDAAAAYISKPSGIVPAWGVPAVNTLILLLSGATVTWAHWGLQKDNRKQLILGLSATVFLGFLFVALQAQEYIHAYQDLNLKLNSGIYGNTFFLLTGFHGLHVTIGALFLAVMLVRAIKGHFTAQNHFAFEAAAWYWHFVDVVWLGLFIFVYWL